MNPKTTAQPPQPQPGRKSIDVLPQAGGSYTRQPNGTLAPTEATPPAPATTETPKD